MEISTFVVLGLIAAAAIYAIMIYNGLVTLKHGVSKAWSNIDVLLKQRHDEIPKLVDTCRQYMQYEQETLERVMKARAAVSTAREQGDVGALGAAEGQLRLGLGNLFAVAEAYPQLRASENFQALQGDLGKIEEAIQNARRYYNAVVRDYNTTIEQVPSNFVATAFRFQPEEYFELVDDVERDVPRVSFGDASS